MRFIAAILRDQRRNNAALDSVGLGDLSEMTELPKKAGYQACCGLIPVTWDHYPPGTKVQLIAQTGAWRYIAQCGDTGVVTKMIQAASPGDNPPDDLYAVKLDLPRRVGKEVAYLTYKEVTKIKEL